MHTAGPKKNFDWRLETPERAYAAGFRRLGIGALFGLADWRYEAICVAAHADFLLRHCWKAQLTISLPRLRPCAGEFQPLTHLADRELVQLVCAFRLMFPDAGLVLSTREPARLRDGLIPLGITLISAGSHTEPGGYTGAGREKIHQTVRGKIVELAAGSSEWAATNGHATNATGQFEIADDRSPGEVAELIRKLGYEPVWKDWDAALTLNSKFMNLSLPTENQSNGELAVLAGGISGRAKTAAAQRRRGAQRRGRRAVGIFAAAVERGRQTGDRKNRRGRVILFSPQRRGGAEKKNRINKIYRISEN